jgi:hypothetical protein
MAFFYLLQPMVLMHVRDTLCPKNAPVSNAILSLIVAIAEVMSVGFLGGFKEGPYEYFCS